MAATSSMLLKMVLELDDKASSKLGGVAEKLADVGQKAGQLAGAATKGVGALSAAVFGLAASSTDVEQVRVAFDNLTASIGESSDVMLQKLREATRGTVSDFELMQSANRLVSMGLAGSADEAAKLVEMAVTLGKAMGEEAGPAIENFALMLANQSIPRLDTYGISGAKVRERILELQEAHEGMSREEAFMIAVMEQGALAMERVGDVWSTSATKTAQLSTMLTNLKDTVGVMVIPILSALVEAVTPLIQQLASWLVPAVQQAVQWFQNLPAPAQQVIAVVMALSAAFTGASAALTVLGPMLPALGAALSALTGPIGVVIAIVAALALAWSTNFLGIRDKTQEVLDAIVPYIQQAIDTVRGVIQFFLISISAWWSEHHEQIKAVTDAVFNAIQSVVSTVISAVSGFIQSELGVVVAWVQANWPLIQQTVEMVLNAVWTVVQTVLSAVQAFWEAHGETIMTIVSNIWDTIKTVIDTVLRNVLDIIKAIMQMITGDWSGAWNTIQGILERTAEALLRIVRNTLDSILSLFGTNLSSLESTIRGFVGNFAAAGQALVDGLKQGIIGKAREIADAAAQLVRDAIAAARAALGIGSPSRVFMEMGEQSAIGYIEGLRAKAKDIEKAAKVVAGTVERTIAREVVDTTMPVRIGGQNTTMPVRIGGQNTTMPVRIEGGAKTLVGGKGGIAGLVGEPTAGGTGSRLSGGVGAGGAVLVEIRDVLIEIRDILAGKEPGLLTEEMLVEALAPIVRRAMALI